MHKSNYIRLIASVSFGWVLIAYLFFAAVFIDIGTIIPNLFLVGFLLSLRYQMAKPVVKAVGAGAAVVGFGYILDVLFNNRDNAFSFGALIGAMIVVFFILMKNIIISLWFLSKETWTLISLFRESKLDAPR